MMDIVPEIIGDEHTKLLVSSSEGNESTPWYAVKLFSVRLPIVTAFFDSLSITYFVPMHYVAREDEHHHVRRQLKPVVSNLIFLKKTFTQSELVRMIAQAPFQMYVYRKERGNGLFQEIPAQEMREFQIMCNPEINYREYLTEEQAQLKEGAPVLVKYGPLKGLTGRLVRTNKKYFLLKEIPGMAVMLKVARWCCAPV